MRQLFTWCCLLTVGISAATAFGPDRALAQSVDNGLEERSVSSFEFDPTAGVVRVAIDLELSNITTDEVSDAGIRRTFFDGYSIPVPLGAENLLATSDGVVLAGVLASDPEFPAFSAYRVAFDAPLFSGESATVRVTYDHLGAPPRTAVPWRVNAAYAAFLAFGVGDDGLITLRISQPFGYEFDESTDLSGFTAGEPDALGTVVYTRSGVNDDVQVIVGMANDDRLVPQQLEVGGADIELRSWPGDAEWADFAAARVESGIPALADLLGVDWPVEGRFAVRQTVEPNLEGYAGWFDARSNEIAVGEGLDADTIYHELSHAWINRALSSERWLTEGLAQVYAAELVRRDGGVPRAPSEPNPTGIGAGPLTEWTGIGSERAVEEFGYAASFWAVDVLVDEIGFERIREVIATLRDDVSAYDPARPAERPDEDWKRAYDVLVEVGGSTAAGGVFRRLVVGTDDATQIDRRDRAVADLASLTQRSEPWSLPVGLLQRQERWEFDDVIEAVQGADDVLRRRTELMAIESVVGIDEPDRAGEAYVAAPMRDGGSVDFSEVTAVLDDAIDRGERLAELQRRITERAEAANVVPPEVATLAGVIDFTTASQAADVQLSAIERLVEVDARLDDATGLLDTIGRWGSDIEAEIDDARGDIERGDNDEALATLENAAARLDDAGTTGALRLAVAVGLILALIVLLAVTRRRRTSPFAP
jgi:hypothetical protein